MARNKGAKSQDQKAFAGTNGNGGGANTTHQLHAVGLELPEAREHLISNDEIAARAYEIYEREGRLDGRALDHWLQAENELRSEFQARGAQRHQGEPAGL